MKSIELKLDKDLIVLSGNKYGQMVYTEQIECKFDGENEVEIVFPDTVKLVSISFTKGLISGMIDKCGSLAKVIDLVKIASGSEDLTHKIERDMVF